MAFCQETEAGDKSENMATIWTCGVGGPEKVGSSLTETWGKGEDKDIGGI